MSELNSHRVLALIRVAASAALACVLSPWSGAVEVIPLDTPVAQRGEHGPHLSESERARLELIVADTIEDLLDRGVIARPTGPAVTLGFPIRAAAHAADFEVYNTSFYVDHNFGMPNLLLDYNCGNRSIDWNGNHRGIDYSSFPFPWLKMANSDVEIVAAAAGTIVFKDDGHPDTCGCGPTPWNAVFVRHADGSVAWYGHLKNGSTTPKAVGETVAAFEYLGVMGTSGCSGSPHLHFELFDPQSFLQDPYAGPCNGLNAESWWTSQPPYYEPAINRLMTGTLQPVQPTCDLEATYEENQFLVGDRIHFTAAIRDLLLSQAPAVFRILRPDGTQYASWTHTTVDPQHLPTDIKTWGVLTDVTDPEGTWKFTGAYGGQFYEHLFFLGSTPSGRVNTDAENQLKLSKDADGIDFSWGSSCIGGNLRGSVHVGQLGNYYNHYGAACDEGDNEASLRWIEAVGNLYFIVVPLSTNREGSYGLDSEGNERPQSFLSCFEVQEFVCP